MLSTILLLTSLYAMPPGEPLPQSKADQLDSLLALIDLNSTDIQNIDRIILAAEQYGKQGKIDESLSYAIKARSLAQQVNYKKGIAHSLLASGANYIKKGAHQAALADLTESEKAFHALHDLSGLGRVNIAIGELYETQSEQKKGYEYHLKALQYFKEGKITDGEIIANNGLGIICYRVGNYELAVLYHLKALSLADSIQKNNIKPIIPGFTLLGSTASALNNLAVIYERLEDYSNALLYYNRCLELLLDEELWRFVGKSESNIAGVYIKTGELKKARKHLDEAYRIFNRIDETRPVYMFANYGDYYTQAEIYDSAELFYNKALRASREMNYAEGKLLAMKGLGDLYLITHQLRKSDAQLELAYQTAKEIDSKPWLIDIYLSKYRLDSARGEFKQSLGWLNRHHHLKDSLARHSKIEQISYLQSYLNQERDGMSVPMPQASDASISKKVPAYVLISAGLATILLLSLIGVFYRYKLVIRKPQ
jgi:tetratricopeptide (TPR) repeat protein